MWEEELKLEAILALMPLRRRKTLLRAIERGEISTSEVLAAHERKKRGGAGSDEETDEEENSAAEGLEDPEDTDGQEEVDDAEETRGEQEEASERIAVTSQADSGDGDAAAVSCGAGDEAGVLEGSEHENKESKDVQQEKESAETQ